MYVYFERGAFVFTQGTETVAKALLDTVVARGGCVLTQTPPFKVKLSDKPGQRKVQGEGDGVRAMG